MHAGFSYKLVEMHDGTATVNNKCNENEATAHLLQSHLANINAS